MSEPLVTLTHWFLSKHSEVLDKSFHIGKEISSKSPISDTVNIWCQEDTLYTPLITPSTELQE